MLSKLKSKIQKNEKLFSFLSNMEKKLIKSLTKISPTIATRYLYLRAMKKRINLNNPKNFNEKVLWLKLNWKNSLVVQCADKLEVRKYVKSMECTEILNELYYVYNDTEDIIWDNLPNKLVLKTTHGSGTNIVSKNKQELNQNHVYKQITKWLKTDFGLLFAETHYSSIVPRIICEKYLETDDGLFPKDYKFFCFNGRPLFLYVGVIDETGYTHKTFYNLKWEKQNFLKPEYLSYDHEQPKNFKQMIEYAKILSKPFPFVRVDLYDVDGKVIFGEMTFTPTGGLATYYNDETLLNLGNLIELPIKYIRT